MIHIANKRDLEKRLNNPSYSSVKVFIEGNCVLNTSLPLEDKDGFFRQTFGKLSGNDSATFRVYTHTSPKKSNISFVYTHQTAQLMPIHTIEQPKQTLYPSAEAYILSHTKEELQRTREDNRRLLDENRKLERDNFAQERKLALIEDKHLLELDKSANQQKGSLSGIATDVLKDESSREVVMHILGKVLGMEETPSTIPQTVAGVVEGKHQELKKMITDFIDTFDEERAELFKAHLIALAPKIDNIEFYTDVVLEEQEETEEEEE